jgi:DNA-binding transcriptional ArsR family regulator
MTIYVGEVDLEVLLALAWAAPLTTVHLTRLLEDVPRTTMGRTLDRLLEAGYIHRTMLYDRPLGKDNPPKRRGYAWQLTTKARDTLPVDELKLPRELAHWRDVITEHDLSRGEILTAIIAGARAKLSGLAIDLEVRLDREQPRPRCDAIILLRRGGAVTWALPWSAAVPIQGQLTRAYAVEVDQDTEGIGIIREKAVAYRRAATDPNFYARYGFMPVPLWLVPEQKRGDKIMQAWAEVWPEGRWCVLTAAGLETLTVDQWNAGEQRRAGLLDGWC